MTRAAPNDCGGFTLLELLVVIGILGLIGGLVFPAIDRGMERAEFRAASSALEFAVREARASALSRGQTTPLVYAYAETGAGIRLSMPRSGVRFYSDGSSNGGVLSLTGRGLVFRMRVDRDTGAIRIER